MTHPRPGPRNQHSPRLPRFTVYLLIAREDGTIYTGYTSQLRRRFKEHNAPGNRGYTRGKRWHLLACRHFIDRDTALLVERQLKRSKYDKRNWIKRLSRLRTLCDRLGIPCSYLR